MARVKCDSEKSNIFRLQKHELLNFYLQALFAHKSSTNNAMPQTQRKCARMLPGQQFHYSDLL